MTINGGIRIGGISGIKTDAFIPTGISGLSLWLDSTTGLYDATSGGSLVTANAASVARWEDQSGNSRHATQSTAGFRATLRTSVQNSRNIIRFDGTDDFYTGISGSLQPANASTRLSFFMACIPDLASRQASFGGGGIIRGMAADNSEGWYFGVRSTGKFAFNQSSGANACIVSTSTLITNTPYIIGSVFDGSQGMTTSTRLTNYLSSTAETDVLDDGSGGWGSGEEIGRGFTSSSYYFKGDLCEIVIYDSALSSENINNVVTYLSTKWSIT